MQGGQAGGAPIAGQGGTLVAGQGGTLVAGQGGTLVAGQGGANRWRRRRRHRNGHRRPEHRGRGHGRHRGQPSTARPVCIPFTCNAYAEFIDEIGDRDYVSDGISLKAELEKALGTCQTAPPPCAADDDACATAKVCPLPGGAQ